MAIIQGKINATKFGKENIVKLTMPVYLKRGFQREANDSLVRIKGRTSTPPSLRGIVQFMPADPTQY